MQATAARTQASTALLARDLFALLAYMLKSSSPDVFSAVGELDLSLTQIKMLHVLDAEPSVSLKHLGACVGLSLPAASRAIDALHRRGLVERREGDVDRRMKQVQVTDAGRDAVQRLNEARLSFLERFAETLTETERKRLIAALAPVVQREEVAACHRERSGSR